MGVAMKILTSEQMASIDRRASETYGIPSIVLMENAAVALAEAVTTHFPSAGTVAIFCGPGQNGGDGFALARHLENRRITPLVYVVGNRKKYRGDAATNLDICVRMGLPMLDVTDADTLGRALEEATGADLVVDGIFGTGLNRPAEGIWGDAIRGLMTLRPPVLAVDLPSGLQGSSRDLVEPVVRADVTVTFAQPKIPHVFDPAASCCGEVIVADITIPDAAVDAEGVTLAVTEPDEVALLFPRRRSETHKGTYGHVAIVSGSAGKSGAAILSARGAVRTGAGLVSVVTDAATANVIDASTLESMTFHADMSASGIAEIVRFVSSKDAALVGPGLPDEESSYALIRELLAKIEIPTVVDATAINAFAGRAAEVNPKGRQVVLTPHPGELARLSGLTTDQVLADRVAAAADAAAQTGCVVVLKGHQTLVATPDGMVGVNPTGNPGMATGGMGDVLGGMIAALLARRAEPFEAARAGVYLHGLAGDIVRDEACDIGISANDVAEMIPRAIARLRGAE
jgi:ADP-dependent NAD(P)H-hydrate dehydratase / NAD(P)H-hydrate epimerase